MTISYSHKVSKVRVYGFTRLLCYWKGSIYKLLYKEMACYVVIYTILACVYRFALKTEHKRLFEKLVIHFDAFTNLIPMSFILGFYVSIVLTRWWAQFNCIPWPDRVATYSATMIRGADESTRVLRRSMIRYLNLASVLVFQSISTTVKKRFPTMAHLVLAGLLTEKERVCFEQVESPHPKFWIPCLWCSNLATRARDEGKITDDINLKAIIDEIMSYRGSLGMLLSYDWISIPLVYTQVTTLAVYTYFLLCLMGRQFVDPAMGYPGHDVDLYVPMFTMLQFFFYVGWIKVAEQLINPFGEDDDDFEMNWIIDRNVQVGLLIVDQMYMSTPDLERDPYWGIVDPQVPYTKSALSSKRDAPFMGSTADLSLTSDDMRVVMNSAPTLEPIMECRRRHDDAPTTSPLGRKMYLDFNCPSPKNMSTEHLHERGSVRHYDLTPTVNGLLTPEFRRPLLVNPIAASESISPGKDWLAYHQEQYLKTLQNTSNTDCTDNSGPNPEESHFSNGERFLNNWLHGHPSISDVKEIDTVAQQGDASSHGAEIGIDPLDQATSRNQNAAHVLNNGSQIGNASCDITNASCDITNASCDITNASCDITNASCDITKSEIHDETVDCDYIKESRGNLETSAKTCESLTTEQVPGNAYVECWLQGTQYNTNNPQQGKKQFEKVPVAESHQLSPPKVRNLQVSFAKIADVGIEMPEDRDEETGRCSGHSSYCTQSTVNSMKALLSSTE